MKCLSILLNFLSYADIALLSYILYYLCYANNYKSAENWCPIRKFHWQIQHIEYFKNSSQYSLTKSLLISAMFLCLYTEENISIQIKIKVRLNNILYFADRGWCISQRQSEVTDRRPRYRLGGNCVSKSHHPPIRLHSNPRHLYQDKP